MRRRPALVQESCFRSRNVPTHPPPKRRTPLAIFFSHADNLASRTDRLLMCLEYPNDRPLGSEQASLFVTEPNRVGVSIRFGLR